MRTILTLGFLAVSTLAFACTTETGTDEQELSPNENIGTVGEKLANNGGGGGYTTRQVCTACGCVASDVSCDCGGSKTKLKCIDNGGPVKKVEPVYGSSSGSIGVFAP